MAKTVDELFKPVAQKRASDAIAEQIKEMIFAGELKPEDRLPSERELALALKTGRMTVREALRMLEESGFILIRQGAEGGAFIKELDGSGMAKTLSDLIKVGNVSLQELTEARVAIETVILESVITMITEEQLDLLHENLEQCESLPTKEGIDQKDSNPYLIDFHLLMASFTRNSLLKYILQAIIDFSTDYIQQYAPSFITHLDHLSQHREIYEALKSKNPVRCRQALEFHLYNVAENVELAMKSSRKKKTRSKVK